jgi:hypothetical protein
MNLRMELMKVIGGDNADAVRRKNDDYHLRGECASAAALMMNT